MRNLLINNVILNVKIGSKIGRDIPRAIGICQGDRCLHFCVILDTTPDAVCFQDILLPLLEMFNLDTKLIWGQAMDRSFHNVRGLHPVSNLQHEIPAIFSHTTV